ncbi:MAG: hypothetical protein ACYC27_09290 [Armatimonadota bacterium]
MAFKEGDYVKIITRESTPADVKNRTFYPYFCGLAGTVDKVYDDEVCIKVDLDTLPEDILQRHQSIQDSIKRKWLNGLSGEARNRLSADEKRFELAYTLLVQAADLEKAKPEDITRIVTKSTRSAGTQKEPAVKPVTSRDLDDAEQQFLKEREEALKDNQ